MSGNGFAVEVRPGRSCIHLLSRSIRQSCGRCSGRARSCWATPAKPITRPSAFDQGYLNHVGIPTANFGAGEQQYAHTDFDMASVERTTEAARVYAFMMLDHLA